MPLTDLCWKRMADMPNGAHIDISTYGDLATLHWVQNEPLGSQRARLRGRLWRAPLPLTCHHAQCAGQASYETGAVQIFHPLYSA